MVNESAFCGTCTKMVSTTVGGICKECGSPLEGAWDLDNLDHSEGR